MTLRNCQSAFSSKHVPVGGYTDDLRHAGAKTTVSRHAANMWGSAVVVRNAGPSLIDLSLENNKARYGGSITIEGSDTTQRLLLSHVNVKDSNAIYGGALLSNNGCFDWKGGTITGSTSQNSGSAIKLMHVYCAEIVLQDLQVSQNTVDGSINNQGGALFFFFG